MNLDNFLARVKERLARWQDELPKLIQPERSHFENIEQFEKLVSIIELQREALELISNMPIVNDPMIDLALTFPRDYAIKTLAACEKEAE